MSRFISNNYRLYLVSSLLIDILTTLIILLNSIKILLINVSRIDETIFILVKIFAVFLIANRFSNFIFKLKFFTKLINNQNGKDDYYPDEALMEEIIDITEENITKANLITKNWVRFNLFMSIPAGIVCTFFLINEMGISSPIKEIISIIILLFTVAELLFYRTVLAKI